MIQDVFIIGATGNVGVELVNQIYQKGDTNPEKHPNPTRIVGMASSSHYLFNGQGICEAEAIAFTKRQSGDSYTELSELVTLGSRFEKLVYVDVTGVKEPAVDFHLKVIGKTPHAIVTANKNPLALPNYMTFDELTNDVRRYGYRCSVMAGAEAVTFLQDLVDVGDTPRLIMGSFSGTLGYLATELQNGTPLSRAVRAAKKLGYTEPDPRDDLNGFDVARKLVVLARTAGFRIGMEHVEIRPFVPKELFDDGSVDEFLAKLETFDGAYKGMFSSAMEEGNTFRYVATLDARKNSPVLTVQLEEVPTSSPLGSLVGTLNKISVVSDAYPEEKPYSVEAPGAGLTITAQNIRRDLLYLLPNRRSS